MAETRHGYFMIQVQAESTPSGPRLSGVAENLATGAKQRFESPGELPDLVRRWGEQVIAEAGRALPSPTHPSVEKAGTNP